MEWRYFPGKFRFRDRVLRDNDIRSAVVQVAAVICPSAQIEWNEATSGLLATFAPDAFDPEKLKPLIPLLKELEPKVRFYSAQKKAAVLEGIEKIRAAAAAIDG